MTVSRPLAALLAIGTIATAAPAFALEDCGVPKHEDCEIQTSDWLAPLDDDPRREVRFFGHYTVAANEGVLDRAVRLALGAGFAYLAVTDPLAGGPLVRTVFGGGGVIMFGTAIAGVCPAYDLLGWNTRRPPIELGWVRDLE